MSRHIRVQFHRIGAIPTLTQWTAVAEDSLDATSVSTV
jgi:hypothetical protein